MPIQVSTSTQTSIVGPTAEANMMTIPASPIDVLRFSTGDMISMVLNMSSRSNPVPASRYHKYAKT